MKKFILILSLVTLVGSGLAQTTTERQKYMPGKVVVKWSTLHLIAHFPSLQIALEHRVYKNMAVQYDFGPILNIGGIMSTVDNNKHGYRAKLQARYYIGGEGHWKFFAASEAGYNKADYIGYRAYHVTPFNEYDYYMFVATPSTYREKNLALLGGFRFSAYHVGLEIQFGAIARSVKFQNDSPGTDYKVSEVNEKKNRFYNHDSRDEIEPTLAVRFCYIIR